MSTSQPSSSHSGLPADAVGRTLQLLLTVGREVQLKDPDKAADCFRQAAEIARAAGRPVDEARALLWCGTVEIQQSHLAQAEDCLARSLLLAREGADPVEIAACVNQQGVLRMRQGRSDDALALLREALSLTVAIPPEGRGGYVRAKTLEALGTLYRDRGDPSQALRYCQDALEFRRATGDAPGIAACLMQMGNLRHRMGQFQDAVALFREALERCRAIEDRHDIAVAANNLGTTLLFQGELEEARERLEESRTLFETLGDVRSVANILSNLGTLAAYLGRVDEADGHYRESLRLHREREDIAGQANALNNLSHLAVVRGQPEEAIRCAEESLALRRRAGMEGNRAKPLFNRGQALLELGRLEDAAVSAHEALAAAEQADSKEQRAESSGLVALVEAAGGRFDTALTAAENALACARESGGVQLIATTHHALGVVRLARGEYDEAKQELARAARLLRGWDRAYERARVLADEGKLLARAGSLEGAVERLRRAAAEFSALGNARWRVRVLADLAALVAKSDPEAAARSMSMAEEAAASAGLQQFFQQIVSDSGSGPDPSSTTGRTGDLVTEVLGAAMGGTGIAGPIEMIVRHLRHACGGARVSLRVDRPAFRRLVESNPPPPNAGIALSRISAPDGTGALVIVSPPGVADGSRIDDTHTDDTRTVVIGLPSTPLGKLTVSSSAGRTFSAEDVNGIEVAAAVLGMAVEWYLERMDRIEAIDTPDEGAVRFESLVGSSRPMRELYRVIAQVAPTDATVLVLGESGTGKELAARAIHARSRRSRSAFVAISCPSIPRELIESELFGHEKGAFTGAIASRPGKIELAHGGTLFLDEVGDMDLMTQVKLLRFLQEREFQRVGGQRSIRVDVRLVAATSRDLTLAMEKGEFREDLFYRLNVVPLRMPALRERREDIAPLLNHFLDSFAAERDVPRRTISARALEVLASHDWPGNVRELRNIVEHLTTLSARDMVDEQYVLAVLRDKRARSPRPSERPAFEAIDTRDVSLAADIRPGETLESRLLQLEARLIRSALEAASWNQSEAARRLGITESKIRNRMRQFGIRKPEGS